MARTSGSDRREGGGCGGGDGGGQGLYSNVSCGKLFLCLGRANSREWDSNRVKLPPEIPQSTVAIKKKRSEASLNIW